MRRPARCLAACACACAAVVLGGCQALLPRGGGFGYEPPPASGVRMESDGGAAAFRPVAEKVGLRVSEGRSAEDLALDVRLRMDDCRVRAPEAPSAESVARMRKMLDDREREVLSRNLEFLERLRRADVYAFPKDR